MTPVRFCLVTTFYPPFNFGGDGIGVQRLARGLARRGHEVTVVHDADAYAVLAPSARPEPPPPDPTGVRVVTLRTRLPRLKKGEYYWSQLEGLKVTNLQGIELGKVSHLFETGSNDVLVVLGERERLIPYLPQIVLAIDLDAGTLNVDWDADF